MTTDARRKNRKPFTPKAAIVYLAALIGLAAAFALPVVLVLANSELDKRKTRIVTQDGEISRLESEIRKAAEREQDLRTQYDLATARSTSLNKSGQQVTVMRMPPVASPNVASTNGKNAKSKIDGRGGNSAAEFETKVSLLYDKVVGRDSPSPDGHSEAFHSRLTRLHEKVVQQNPRE